MLGREQQINDITFHFILHIVNPTPFKKIKRMKACVFLHNQLPILSSTIMEVWVQRPQKLNTF